MAQKKTTTSIRPDDYAAFLKTLQFRGFGLEQSSSHLNRYAFGAALADKQEFITDVNADYSVSLHDDDKFIVSGQFEVKQSLASKEQIVAISSMFTALFETSTRAKKENVERFAKTEAKLIFWPYLRAFVSDITGRMAINPILLPLTTALEGQATVVKASKPRKRVSA